MKIRELIKRKYGANVVSVTPCVTLRIHTIQQKYLNNKRSLIELNTLEAVIQWYICKLAIKKSYCDTTPTTIYNIIHHYKQCDKSMLVKFMEETSCIKNLTNKALNEIFKLDRDTINWNEEHTIKMHSDSDYFQIWNYNIISKFSNKKIKNIYIYHEEK